MTRRSRSSKARRSKGGERRRLARAALAQHAQRLGRYRNVIAVGVGVPYLEKTGRFEPPPGQQLPLALKVLVRRKPRRVRPAHRLPKNVVVRLTRGRHVERHRIRVDVVLQGEAVTGVGFVGADKIDPQAWPQTGSAKPGHRLLAGRPEANAGSSPASLAAGYYWEIGTVGAVVRAEARRYIMTAGHVVGRVYSSPVGYPSRCRIGFSRTDPALSADGPGPPVPPSPTDGTLTIDAVAVPLTPTQAASSTMEAWSVADIGDMDRFLGQAAMIRVERAGRVVDLPGTVEAAFKKKDVNWAGLDVTLGPTLLFRCGGALPVDGDSGAPVWARDPDGGGSTLLGFHVSLRDSEGSAAPVSYVMVAYPALGRAKVGLAT